MAYNYSIISFDLCLCPCPACLSAGWLSDLDAAGFPPSSCPPWKRISSPFSCLCVLCLVCLCALVIVIWTLAAPCEMGFCSLTCCACVSWTSATALAVLQLWITCIHKHKTIHTRKALHACVWMNVCVCACVCVHACMQVCELVCWEWEIEKD